MRCDRRNIRVVEKGHTSFSDKTGLDGDIQGHPEFQGPIACDEVGRGETEVIGCSHDGRDWQCVQSLLTGRASSVLRLHENGAYLLGR